MLNSLHYTQIERKFNEIDQLERQKTNEKNKKRKQNTNWKTSHIPKSDINTIDDALKVRKYRNNLWNSLQQPSELRSHDVSLVETISFKTRELHPGQPSPHKNPAEQVFLFPSAGSSIHDPDGDHSPYFTPSQTRFVVPKSAGDSPTLGSKTFSVQPNIKSDVRLYSYKNPHGAMSPFTREFYFVSIAIDHPRILAGWRFRLDVSDSINFEKIYTMTDLEVDCDNFLLFPTDSLTPPNVFSPTDYLPWVHEPRELMGHELNFVVTSLTPAFPLKVTQSVTYYDKVKAERYDGRNIVRVSPTPTRSPIRTKSPQVRSQSQPQSPLPPIIIANKQILYTKTKEQTSKSTQTDSFPVL